MLCSALFGLLARRRLQGLGVVQRDLVEQEVGHHRVRRAKERLAAAGAFLEVEPHDGRSGLGVHRPNDLADGSGRDAGCGSQPTTESQEIAT